MIRQLTAGSILRNNFAERFIFEAKSRPGPFFFCLHVWKCFDGAYSSSGSSEDLDDGSVQWESNGSNEGDDAIVVDVQKAAEKPKTFVIELQLHYFSLHAKQPTAEEKTQLALNWNDSDVSHVMLPKGKLAVFVIPATEKDILMKIASDEAEVDSAEQDSFFYILFLLRSVFQIIWPPNYVMEMQMKL